MSIEIFFIGVVRVPQYGAMKFTAQSAALLTVLLAEESEVGAPPAGTTDAAPFLAASCMVSNKSTGRGA